MVIDSSANAGVSSAQSRSLIFIQKMDSFMQMMPIMQVGDIVPLVVRQNYGNGQGLINVQGQVIHAALPNNLKVGDKLYAQLTDTQDKVTLKILEGYKPPGATALLSSGQNTDSSTAILLGIVQQLEEAVTESGIMGIQVSTALTAKTELPPELQTLINSNKNLALLFSAIQSMEALFNPENAHSQLQAAASGSLAKGLYQASSSLKELLEQLSVNNTKSFLNSMNSSLSAMIKDLAAGNSISESLHSVLEELQSRIKDPLISADENRLLSQYYKELYQLRNKQELGLSVLPNLQSSISNTQQTLTKELSERNSRMQRNSALLGTEWSNVSNEQIARNNLSNTTEINQLDPKLILHLRDVVTKLDQMAATAETLNRLNPIMQAIGEPALVLFPFLFEGFISQGEVALNTPPKPAKYERQKDEEAANDSENKSSGKKSQFQHFHVNVPLPNLGLIDVAIAQSPEHIMVKFTTERADVKEFISQRLQDLQEILNAQGFQITELSTQIGKPKSPTPDWCITLRGGNSFIA